jgi:PAS domain S-box-containing protein
MFERLRPALASSSLARRFAVAAAILTAAAVLLIALMSFWLVNEQHVNASAVLEQREVAFHAKTVASNLKALSTRISEVANNPIIATGLVDSAGRELYLTPFLHGLRQINGIPVDVVLTDFEGKPIATNGAQPFTNEELAWLREQIARDSERAVILEGQPGARLLGVEFLRYSRTSTPEGALVYKIRLSDLVPAPWASFAWTGHSSRHVATPEVRSMPVSVPPNMAQLGLRLEADTRALADPLRDPSLQYAGIVAIALALAGIVYLVGTRLADGLTRDLRRLETFSSTLGAENLDTGEAHDSQARAYAELVGSSEVTSLARSINRMIDRLYQQRTSLQDERQRFYQLANTIPQLAWMAEPDGSITWYNERWYAYTGTTPEEMRDSGWMKVHHPAVLPGVIRDWTRAIANGEAVSMSFPLRGADGQYRRFFTSFAPLRDQEGRITQWFGTNTDMSQIEQAEQAVRRSEERLQQGLIAARMAVWEWTVASGALSFSANLSSVFGMEFDNMRAVWPLIAASDLPALRAAIDQALSTGGECHALVRLERAGDGHGDDRPLWLDLRGHAGASSESAGADAGASVQALHMIAIDVTERMRAEEALLLADQRKDEFLAMLAHELRNPLAPIGSAAAMLEMAWRHEPRVHQIGAIIARQVKHMTRLVDDLLDVSRVTRGLVTVQRELVDLRPVASEAVEQIRPLALARTHQLNAWMPDAPVWVRCDRTRLVQVFTNLLNNAVKYSPPGARIDLRLEVRDRYAVLTVRDTGAGIGADLLPHVFDLFTQGKRTLDRAEGGLGLGLALARKLVELHGGTIGAESEGEGRGSVFTVRLPLEEVQQSPLAPGDAPGAGQVAAPDQPRLRLLVVDDNVDAADSLAMLLEVDGHDAAVAYSPRVALEMAAQAPYDAMLLDIGMPEIDGYTLAGQLRAAGVTAALVAVTGYGQEQDKTRSRAAGFADHLVKPIDREALVRVMEMLRRGAWETPRAGDTVTAS